MKACVIIICLLGGCLLSGTRSSAQGPRLTKLSMKAIAEATANQLEKVYVHIAAKEARTEKVADRVRQFSGEVFFADTTVGYLRAIIPLSRVYDLAGDADIDVLQVIDLSQTLQVGVAASPEEGGIGRAGEGARRTAVDGDAAPMGESRYPQPIDGSGAGELKALDYPFDKAYHPWQDVDVPDLLKRDSNYDGRGVTTSFVESNPNLTMPEMKYSYDLKGKMIKKVPDIVLSMDKDSVAVLRIKEQWYSFGRAIVSSGRRLSFRDTVYNVPYDGEFGLCYSVDKSQWRRGALHHTGPFAILWDKKKECVWIDHNHNHDFSDDKKLQLYTINQDVDTAGFVLLAINDATDQVFLTSTDHGQHTPMVYASIAANKKEGGLFNGMAPGAAEIAYLHYAEIDNLETIIKAMRDPRVEIVGSDNAMSYNITEAKGVEVNTGSTVYDVIIGRCIQKFNKLFVKAALNDDGLGNVDFMVAGDVLSVGAYHSKENLRINNGVVQPENNDLHWFSSWGPDETGEVKPDILAPSQWITYYYSRPVNDPDMYNYPAGYKLGGGTSQACPTAEGGVALVMSACKQSHIPYDARSLKWAVTSTARYLPELQAVEQGNGLLQVNKAYELLRELAGGKQGGYSLAVGTKANVNTGNSHLLPVPYEGVGIFEKIGWKPGSTGVRTIRLLRRKGVSKPVVCRVQWLGNTNGVFSADTLVSLPLGKEVELRVKVRSLKPGVNSALIKLTSDNYVGDVCKVMVCIVAPEAMADSFVVTKHVDVARPNGKAAGYFSIPDSIRAFSVKYTTPVPELESWLNVRDPVYFYNRDSRYLNGMGGSDEAYCDNPDAGTYEVLVHDRRDMGHLDLKNAGKPLPPMHESYTLNFYGIKESGYRGEIRDTALQPFKFTNAYAAFSGGMVSNALGSLRSNADSLAKYGSRLYEVSVDSGSTQLSVYYNMLTAGADIDVYVFAPIVKEGKTLWQLKDWSCGYRQSGFIEIPDPGAGVWKIVVTNGAVNARYAYFDLVQHPKYGSFTSTDGVRKHAVGDQWAPEGKIWVNPKGGFLERKPAVLVKVGAKEGVQGTVGWEMYEIKGF